MSKVSEIKEKAKWQKNGPMCSNCTFFSMERETITGPFGPRIKDSKKRCNHGSSSGVFATGLSCWCINHRWIVTK